MIAFLLNIINARVSGGKAANVTLLPVDKDPGQFIRHSDGLQVRQLSRSPTSARDFSRLLSVQTGSVAHAASSISSEVIWDLGGHDSFRVYMFTAAPVSFGLLYKVNKWRYYLSLSVYMYFC